MCQLTFKKKRVIKPNFKTQYSELICVEEKLYFDNNLVMNITLCIPQTVLIYSEVADEIQTIATEFSCKLLTTDYLFPLGCGQCCCCPV